jgi:hypothetical protein
MHFAENCCSFRATDADLGGILKSAKKYLSAASRGGLIKSVEYDATLYKLEARVFEVAFFQLTLPLGPLGRFEFQREWPLRRRVDQPTERFGCWRSAAERLCIPQFL